MRLFRLALLGSVVIGVGAIAADRAFAADVKKKVRIYGLINRMISVQDDGNTTLINHHDNALSGSRFGVYATARSADIAISGRFEWQFQSNSSSTPTTTQRQGAGSGEGDGPRWSDISFANKYGTMFMGHGSSASNGTVSQDLSGTGLIQTAGNPLSSGMGFSPRNLDSGGNSGGTETDNAYQVRDVINSVVSNGRTNRVRFNSRRIGGFKFSVSNEHGGRVAANINYRGTVEGVKYKTQIGMLNNSSTQTGGEEAYGGSFSALHMSSGISATYAYGIRINDTGYNHNPGNVVLQFPNEGRQTLHYGKLGYQKDFSKVGRTYASVDWTVGYDGVTDGDRATKFGLGVVQKLSAYGAELYTAYEWLRFNRGDAVGQVFFNGNPPRYSDIHAGYFGARVRW